MLRRAWLAAVLFSIPGCGLTGFEDGHRLDPEDIQSLIDKAPYPDLTPPAKAVPPSRIVVKPDGRRTVELNLVEALRLSLANNQGYLSSGENLDVQLLSLEVLRRSWWPLQEPLTGSVSWADASGSDPASSQALSASVGQKLPWGGSATLSFSEAGAQGPGPNFYSGAVTAGFNLPLLRGGGWRVAVEEKVGAERGYAYARRSYVFSRTDLLIQTVQSYFGILQQEVNIGNSVRNVESARRGVRQAELQFVMGRVSRTDVFRAELNLTNADNQLTNAREQFRLTLDTFKIDLGLRPEDELVLDKEKLEFKPLEVKAEEAIAGAFATNPQWLNARDQFDDAGRALEIARNATLPQVDVGASYSWLQEPANRPFEEFETGSRALSLTGSFSLDLDTLSLNRTYQAAVISYRQAERNFQRARDGIARETQTRLTQLRQSETNTVNQKRAIGEAEKQVQLITFEYGRGRVRNFEVINAQEQLLNARNGYEAALVAAKVSQLRVLHWIGRLEPDDEGRWVR